MDSSDNSDLQDPEEILLRAAAYLEQLKIRPLVHLSDSEARPSDVAVDDLPLGVSVGSAMVAYDADVPAEVRSAVALCALVAQRRANSIGAPKGSDRWLDSHLDVFQNLNWVLEHGSTGDLEAGTRSAAINEAVIPFLSTALGPGGATGSTILSALRELGKGAENKRWYRIFDRSARGVNITEHFFGHVSLENGSVVFRIATVRISGTHKMKKVLLYKGDLSDLQFHGRSFRLVADAALLSKLNPVLKTKLQGKAESFLAALDIGD